MNRKTRSTKIRNTNKVLKYTANSATIVLKKVAGFAVEGLKKFWNNWQWALALVALLYAILLFYYQSTTSTPARLSHCEEHLARHEQESKEHFEKLDASVADLNVLNAGISAQLTAIKEDTAATKSLLFELLGKRL